MSPRLRLGALTGGLVSLAAVAYASGLSDALTPTAIQGVLHDAGPAGMVGFLVVFALGTLASIPGVVFIFAALLAYGPVTGGLLSLAGGILAAALNFCVIRKVGGDAAAGLDHRAVRWSLARLEQRPVAATAALRALTVLAPPVNVALALSPIRYRDYVVGTALGLIAPIGVYAVFFDCLVAKALS